MTLVTCIMRKLRGSTIVLHIQQYMPYHGRGTVSGIQYDNVIGRARA